MSMPSVFYIRQGDNGPEFTNQNDPRGFAFVRADTVETVETISMLNGEDRFVAGGKYDDNLKAPCCDCLHNQGNVYEYPCAYCAHSFYT